MIKLLFNLFKKQFTRLAFNTQSKPVDKTMLKQAFIDSNGVAYYVYSDDLDLPIVRFGYLQKCLTELECGISQENLILIIETIEKAMQERDNKGRMAPNLAMIGHLALELKNRMRYLFPGDILLDLAATVYIRHDENPAALDMEIHAQKIEQFKKDSARGGLRDFFHNEGLGRYLPYLKNPSDEQEAMMHLTSLLKQIDLYSSESISAKG